MADGSSCARSTRSTRPSVITPDPTDAEQVDAAAREAYARVVATLIRVTGDWTLAEDSAQDALATALERWPRDGVPANPGGWLMTVARNRATDVVRRRAVEDRKLRELASIADPADGVVEEGSIVEELPDDRLRLVFTCCHPALSLEARVALTLRIVCGVPASEVARRLLVSESTMTRRITRAKARIADAGIPYRVPTGDALAERVPGVLAVVYLLFTTGYDPAGEPAFADEAVRLARLLVELMPDEPEAWGLLALCLLQHSRRTARHDADGVPLRLDEQDRSAWDRTEIDAGLEALARAGDGPYALQARIAGCHATATSVAATDWARIAAAYDALAALQPSPVVELNRAVAHGYAYGPRVGLQLLPAVRSDPRMAGDPLPLAVEADLLEQLGELDRAAALFRAAAELTRTGAERGAMLKRADAALGSARDTVPEPTREP